MTALFIVFTDAQGPPEVLAFLDLRLRQLMYLMRLQPSSIRPTTIRSCLFRFKLFTQCVAQVIDLVFIDPATTTTD